MIARHVLTVLPAFVLSSLLGACGPGNTLYSTAPPPGIKSLAASVQKNQEALKHLEQRQLQTEARIAALQKRVGLASHDPEAKEKNEPQVPQGSALGMGFARPGASAATEATRPQTVSEPTQSRTTRPTSTQVQPETSHPTFVRPPLEKRHRGGRVGAAPAVMPPVTPEAAIAADRAERPSPVEAPAAHSTSAPTPAAPVSPPHPATTPAPMPATPPGQATPPPAAAPVSHAPQAAPVPMVGSVSTVEKTAYNNALQLAINGHQDAAKAAFEQFLTAYPQSSLTPNALYWVGEGAYQRGDYQGAVQDFDKVVKGWPGHRKAADALYKMALAQEKAGNTAAARETLKRYLKEYPKGELAGTTRQKLQALSQ